MSTADNIPYVSRFLMKFVEIIAAGLATAASGYLIAHLSGALSSPTSASRTAVVVTPNVSVIPGLAGEPTPFNSVDTNQRQTAPQQELNVPRSMQPAPAPTTANIAKPASPNRHSDNAQRPTESTRDHGSWANRVRAALANAASRPDPAGNSQHQNVIQPAANAQPGAPTDFRNTGAVGASGATGTALRPAPLEETTVRTNSSSVVETTSHSVAATQPSAAPLSVKETGTLSTLEQMLRNDPLAGTDDAPRPPMPVGQE